MPEKEKIILPPRYYLDYFTFLLDFIRQRSGHLLGQEDEDFIHAFTSLSIDAQCLFIRMINRKGEYFRLDKLRYEEISRYPEALEELCDVSFISTEPENEPILFRLFTKSELHHLYPERGLRQLPKENVLLTLEEDATAADYLTLYENYQLIHLLAQEQVEFLKMLFFGRYRAMMTEFVVRDVGHVRLENLDHHDFKPWFASREEAVATFRLHQAYRAFRKTRELILPEEMAAILAEVPWEEYLRYPGAIRVGDKLMLSVGEYFEKMGLPTTALDYYARSGKHPARERRIRILDKAGDTQESVALATEALNHPLNASEYLFAKDFLEKRSLRNYRTTSARIKTSPQIILQPVTDVRVEELALQHFRTQGYEGVHSENYLWRALFGLTFWTELFDQESEGFHHPLQRMPSDLYGPEFYERRGGLLKAKTRKYRTRRALCQLITETHREKEHIANYLVGWHPTLLPTLLCCIERLPVQAIHSVLLEMARNVRDNSAGFPDLFIWTANDYHFYEIKSPNDHLSAQQLFWIDFLKKHNIKAEILRIYYQ